MSKEDQEALDMANGVKPEKERIEPAYEGVVSPKKKAPWSRREFRRMISEVSGWTGFGAVMLTCMLVGAAPMWLAAPVFTGCFAWVAVQVDRYFRR